MDFLVGSFNRAELFTLHFQPPNKQGDKTELRLIRRTPSIGPANWLSLSLDRKVLYTTAWNDPNPAIAAYRIRDSGRQIDFVNAKPVRSTPGYVCASTTHVYSCGGPTGDVFKIEHDGAIGEHVQSLDFTGMAEGMESTSGDWHGPFGGLRDGSHGCDLSPDGRSLYIADIGRNCIWSYSVNLKGKAGEKHLVNEKKTVSVRSNDGCRHTWPHPNGKVLYCVQEHSSMVDVFTIGDDGVSLTHKQGVKIIPKAEDPALYWADEVRISRPAPTEPAKYMYASVRGLKPERMGWVSAFPIDEEGYLTSEEAIDMWETPTCGGLANAIEPAPYSKKFSGVEYLAMPDSQEGLIFMLGFDGKKISEVARVEVENADDGTVIGCATAVWLSEGDPNPALSEKH